MKDVSYLKTWFYFFVIATVGGLVAGMVAGLVLGFILGVAGYTELEENRFIFQAAGWLVGLPVSYYSFRWAVSEYIVKDLVDGYRRPEIQTTNTDSSAPHQ